MPTQCLPTLTDIERIWKELEPRGFFLVQGLDHFRRTKKDVQLIAPYPRVGAELGFSFQKDDLTLTMWTSWVPGLPEGRSEDSGWVVIEQAGDAKYFLPLHRTKNFVDHFIMEAKIARCRIRHRPECFCKTPMSIVYGKGLGARFWRCPHRHLIPSDTSWDTPAFLAALPAEARQYLRRRRRSRKRWQKRRKNDGMPIRVAMLKRKGWKKKNLPVTGF